MGATLRHHGGAIDGEGLPVIRNPERAPLTRQR